MAAPIELEGWSADGVRLGKRHTQQLAIGLGEELASRSNGEASEEMVTSEEVGGRRTQGLRFRVQQSSLFTKASTVTYGAGWLRTTTARSPASLPNRVRLAAVGRVRQPAAPH